MKNLENLVKDGFGVLAILLPTDFAGKLGLLSYQEVIIQNQLSQCNKLISSYDPTDPDFNYILNQVNNLFLLLMDSLKRYNGHFKQYFLNKLKDLQEKEKLEQGY